MDDPVEVLKAQGINGLSDPRNIQKMDNHVQQKESAHQNHQFPNEFGTGKILTPLENPKIAVVLSIG